MKVDNPRLVGKDPDTVFCKDCPFTNETGYKLIKEGLCREFWDTHQGDCPTLATYQEACKMVEDERE